MKTLGNIIWHFPFLGFVSATLIYLLGVILTATVIAAPIGLGLMEYGKFLFWPFGNAMISKKNLNVESNSAWQTYSTIIMVLYFPFGLIIACIKVFQIAGLFISIVGIPVALVLAKSLGTVINPVNKICVHAAIADEIERKQAQTAIEHANIK